jgi:hypothetical protein
MGNSAQAFFNKSRKVVDLGGTFAQIDASVLGGVVLLRRAADSAHVSTVGGHALVRRTEGNAHVAGLGMHVLLRQAQLVQLFDRSATGTGARVGRASWGTRIPTGDVFKTNASGIYAIDYTWMLAGVVADYEIRATVISGSNPTAGDALNTWLSLSSDREWRYQVSGRGKFIQGTIKFEIRDTSTSTVQDECNVLFTAYTDGAVFV